MTERTDHDPARQSRATRFMLVAVIGFSAIPVYIAVADTHRAPFVFTAFLYAGQFVGLGAYTLLTYRALFFRRGPLGVIARQVVRPTMLLTLTGYLNYAFYSWSTEYIDPAVTTVIFGGWTFTTVLFVGWTFRSERRYERTSGALVGFMLIGFAGFALAILSQRADIFDFGQGAAPLIEVGIGVVLAVISMSMATLGSFVLKWGVETAQRVDATADHPYEQSELEVAGVLTGIVVAALIAIPVNLALGLARGESIVGIFGGHLGGGLCAGVRGRAVFAGVLHGAVQAGEPDDAEPRHHRHDIRDAAGIAPVARAAGRDRRGATAIPGCGRGADRGFQPAGAFCGEARIGGRLGAAGVCYCLQSLVVSFELLLVLEVAFTSGFFIG